MLLLAKKRAGMDYCISSRTRVKKSFGQVVITHCPKKKTDQSIAFLGIPALCFNSIPRSPMHVPNSALALLRSAPSRRPPRPRAPSPPPTSASRPSQEVSQRRDHQPHDEHETHRPFLLLLLLSIHIQVPTAARADSSPPFLHSR